MAAKNTEEKKGGNIFVPLIMATLLAIGAGAGFGLQITKLQGSAAEAPSPENRNLPLAPKLQPIGPVVANLSDASKPLIRIEATALFDADVEDPTILSTKITSDFVTYLHTVSLAQLEGATGFQLLKDDLTERARIRSGGKTRDLFVSTFIIE